jgi:hypothetical protein
MLRIRQTSSFIDWLKIDIDRSLISLVIDNEKWRISHYSSTVRKRLARAQLRPFHEVLKNTNVLLYNKQENLSTGVNLKSTCHLTVKITALVPGGNAVCDHSSIDQTNANRYRIPAATSVLTSIPEEALLKPDLRLNAQTVVYPRKDYNNLVASVCCLRYKADIVPGLSSLNVPNNHTLSPPCARPCRVLKQRQHQVGALVLLVDHKRRKSGLKIRSVPLPELPLNRILASSKPLKVIGVITPKRGRCAAPHT